jgi:hypothetical protein
MKYQITVLDEVYTHKIVEADSPDAIEDGNYEVIEEFPGNAGECDQIITIETMGGQ